MGIPGAAEPVGNARRVPSGRSLMPIRRVPVLLLVVLTLAAASAIGGSAEAALSSIHGADSLWIKGTLAYQPRAHLACHCPNWYGPAGRLPPPAPGVR